MPLGSQLRSAAAAHRACRQLAAATALQRRGANEAQRSGVTAAISAQRRRSLCTGPADVEVADYVVVGAGPVGASTAWFLSEHEQAEDKSIVLIHDPTDRGAHEDWSRLARLSFDGPADEMELSRHAVSLLDGSRDQRGPERRENTANRKTDLHATAVRSQMKPGGSSAQQHSRWLKRLVDRASEPTARSGLWCSGWRT